MREMIRNKIVTKDIMQVYNDGIVDWQEFKGKTFFITGVTGGIGSFLARTLLNINEKENLNIKVVGLIRNEQRAKEFFGQLLYNKAFKLVLGDVNKTISYNKNIDYIIHCANNTSSKSFVEQPVETMDTAINGTKNILDFATEKQVKSAIYLSSMEVYGLIEEERKLKENDLGALDLSEVRNSYPVGKRAAEMLCCSYFKEKNIPVKIARLAQIIGANISYNDSRVYAQFARSIVEKKDIILNTTGETTRSYCYMTDLINAILLLLLKGQNGEIYNVANEDATIKIKDMAKNLCEQYPDSNLIFDINNPNMYFKCTHWMLDAEKIKTLGWKANVTLSESYQKLISSFYTQKTQLDEKSNTISYLHWYQKIFSIKNIGKNKMFTILGFQFQIDRQKFLQHYRQLPIQNNKIVFSNYMGSGYGCNPKYIAEEIIKRKLPYDLVWLAKPNIDTSSVPKEIRIVNYTSKEALKELITAKVWVDNYHKISFLKKGLKKRPGQIYIQTWHGSLGIKKIEKLVNCLTKDKLWEECAIENSRMTDYWISNSKFETMVYKESFWDVENIKEFGHPRNDIFFKKDESIEDKVKEFYNINKNKSIMLYAPSFREDESLRYYQLDYNALKQALETKTNKQWTILVRLHPRVAKFSQYLLEKETDVIDASQYPDIQELLFASDSMITDYSSCIFDFMLSKKPAFIYANDISDYNQERGFYYPLESTPFPIATTMDELIENIKCFNYDEYNNEVESFLVDKGCIEEGKAAEKVVDFIDKSLTGYNK